MTVMTADGKAVAKGTRVFNFHDGKWGLIVDGGEQTAELAYDDGTRTAVDCRWILSKDPSRPTW